MGKTITTFLIDGKPQGVRYDTIGNRVCQMYVIPRSRLNILDEPNRDELRKPAFYILLGESDNGKAKAYIGETENFSDRVKEHNKKKDFWQKALVFISNAKDGLMKTDVKYLEHCAIKEAKEVNRYDLSENGKDSFMPNIAESRRSVMDEFYEDVKFLTSFLGCDIFSNIEQKASESIHYFTTNARGCKAKGYYGDEGFTILKGAVMPESETASYHGKESRQKFLHAHAIKNDKHYILTSDYVTQSPSMAACLVCGRNCNGWVEWKDAEGRTLDEVYRKG